MTSRLDAGTFSANPSSSTQSLQPVLPSGGSVMTSLARTTKHLASGSGGARLKWIRDFLLGARQTEQECRGEYDANAEMTLECRDHEEAQIVKQ
jgi:hypothetical protein